jgi:hypothetical protein
VQLAGQKMVNGGVVNHWACLNFSRSVQENYARNFCAELAQMCQTSGMVLQYIESLYPFFFFKISSLCPYILLLQAQCLLNSGVQYDFFCYFCIRANCMWKASCWLYVGPCCILQDFQSEPFVPVRSARQEHSDRALLQLCEEVKQRTQGKGLDLLIAILPDNNGPLYGMSVSSVWF